ncbi:MerR family transcriptional regulator [Euzebya rosea]|uniref:MerR family transcriptional regulator n=1 Tax=Euzebya rosea TaxID=2052804 RepID=UPI000D3EA773|nr:MerR family transcriptional regulator [Euzebya rosea]
MNEPDREPVPLYAARAAAGLAGVTYRQLDHWATTGLITLTVPAEGSGSRRLVSPADVAGLCRVAQLRDLGVTLAVAAHPPDGLARLVDDDVVAATVAALQHLPVLAYFVDGRAVSPEALQRA